MVHGVIYVHINKINGHCYVGQTWQNTKRRWGKTSRTYQSYRNTEVFYKALCKYGWEAFDSIVLCSCTTQESMNLMEEYFIKFYNCLAPNGYNLRDICNGRERHTDETKKKMSEKAKSRINRPDPWNKQHLVEIEGKQFKKCGCCLKHLEVTENFCKVKNHYKSRCHKCTYLYNPYEQMDAKLKAESFKVRGEKFKEIHGTPEKRAFYKQLHSKPIQKLDPKTKQILKEYSCAKDALPEGFKGPGISTAIKMKDLYKGFYWEFAGSPTT